MKVIVKQTFHDKDCYAKVYQEGMEYEFEDARAQHLASLNLVTIKDETPTECEALPPKDNCNCIPPKDETPEVEVPKDETPTECEKAAPSEAPRRGRKPKAE